DGRPTSLVEPTEPFARDLVARQGGACCFRSSLPRSYPTRARSGNPRVRSPFCGTVTNRVESSYRTHGERRATPPHPALLAARTCAEPFGVFYERHFASVLGFFRRRVRGPEEAFDLAAETFAAALASLPRLQPGPEPAQAWLFAIARHKLSEAVRSSRVQ